MHEGKRIACASFQKSFLFEKRPLSPEINAFKQEEYSQSLLKQMESKREKEIKQRQNKELMDRLEQVQLTEEWVQHTGLERRKFCVDANFFVGLNKHSTFR